MSIETKSSVYNYYQYKLKQLNIPKEHLQTYAEKQFKKALESGASLQDAENIKTMFMILASIKDDRQKVGADGELIEPLKEAEEPHTCNRLADISDELWKELISNYDMEKLDYNDRRALTKDFENYGLISAEERKQLLDEFDRIEETSKSMKPRPILEYDQEKYPTIYDYLRENVKDASPEASAAMRESMVVRNKFEHYIEHMKAYSQKNL